MEHTGFSIIHVASPCTTYNDTFVQLKGSAKLGIDPSAWTIPDDHDVSDLNAARTVIAEGGVPLGVIYEDKDRPSFDEQFSSIRDSHTRKTAEELLNAFAL